MKTFVKKYGFNVTSQNGENGIIAEVLRRIQITGGVAIEFGAPTKEYCSNIFPLDENWNKMYFDTNPQEHGIVISEVTPENVNDLPNCDVLSIDIDGNDFNVWKAYKGKPAIVVIEINSSLDPYIEFFHPSRGSSFITMNRLAEDKGYFLLCHTGNCIYVLNENKFLFPEITIEGEYFNHKWLEVV